MLRPYSRQRGEKGDDIKNAEQESGLIQEIHHEIDNMPFSVSALNTSIIFIFLLIIRHIRALWQVVVVGT
jgi:hypothetical protein